MKKVWREFEITKADVRKAMRAHDKRKGSVCQTCPVFQSLKRSGVDVFSVALSAYAVDEEKWVYRLDDRGQVIAHAYTGDWDQLLYACPIPFKAQVAS